MKRALAACAVGLLAALAPSFAGAQGTFPTRTVRFIVPFPGGGINDSNDPDAFRHNGRNVTCAVARFADP